MSEAGRFEGREYRVGEVLVCRGAALPNETTILVPRGVGHPRFGMLVFGGEGARMRGDAGEPCSPARFRSAGRLVARVRREAREWHLVERLVQETEAVGGLSAVAFAGSAAVEESGGTSSTAQLGLFDRRTVAA